jgi:hypothetical protein
MKSIPIKQRKLSYGEVQIKKAHAKQQAIKNDRRQALRLLRLTQTIREDKSIQ